MKKINTFLGRTLNQLIVNSLAYLTNKIMKLRNITFFGTTTSDEDRFHLNFNNSKTRRWKRVADFTMDLFQEFPFQENCFCAKIIFPVCAWMNWMGFNNYRIYIYRTLNGKKSRDLLMWDKGILRNF